MRNIISAKKIFEIINKNKNISIDKNQEKIIEAPWNESILVKAGAGSGKTETMSYRIVYLIINEFVKPNEILCLTFTNKAVQELIVRVRKHLSKVRNQFNKNINEKNQNNIYDIVDYNKLFPEISTYDSFFNLIAKDYGLLDGINPFGKIMTSADEFLLVRKIINRKFSDDDFLTKNLNESAIKNELLKKKEILENKIVNISNEIATNLKKVEEVEEYLKKINIATEHYENFKNASRGTTQPKNNNPKDINKNINNLLFFLKLVKEYNDEKEKNELVTFSDRLFYANNISKHKYVKNDIENKYKIVILDEYQDTSIAQTNVLKELFLDTPITAVGDENQAIYGWRGANVDAITNFVEIFKIKNKNIFPLLVSYRNSKKILDVANSLFEIELEPKKNAENGVAEAKFFDMQKTEVENVVKFLKESFSPNDISENYNISKNDLNINKDSGNINSDKKIKKIANTKKTAAILFPARHDFIYYEYELQKQNIPYEITDPKGLIEKPEIVQIIDFINIATNPNNNPELILKFLQDYKFFIKKNNYYKLKETIKEKVNSKKSLFEILCNEYKSDDIDETNRINSFINKVKEIQNILYESNTVIIHRVINLLNLNNDIEISAKYYGNINSAKLQKNNISKFIEYAYEFDNSNNGNSIGLFLEFLKYTKERDFESELVDVEAKPGIVQLSTIHGAKGLEWDIVCSVSNTESIFNNSSKINDITDRKNNENIFYGKKKIAHHWTSKDDMLPIKMLLDYKVNNDISFEKINNKDDYYAEMVEIENYLSEIEYNERRRLAYVAYTRAKEKLLITGAFHVREAKTQFDRPTDFFIDAYCEIKNITQDDAIKKMKKRFIKKVIDEIESEEKIWPFIHQLNDRLKAINFENIKINDLAEETKQLVNNLNRKNADLLTKQSQNPKRINVTSYSLYKKDKQKYIKNKQRSIPIKPISNTIQTNIGNFVHKYIQCYLNKSIPLDDDISVSEMKFSEKEINLIKKGFAQRIKVFKKYAEQNNLLNSIKYCEYPFAYKRDNINIIGKIDAIFYDEKNNIWTIVDWKTRSKKGAKKQDEESQLKLYKEFWAKHNRIPAEKIETKIIYITETEIEESE